MDPSSLHYFPIPILYVVGLALVVGVLIVLLEIRVLGYAFETMGIERRHVLSILMLCLLGSSVNIPIAELPPEQVASDQVVRFFGVPYHTGPGEPESQQAPGQGVRIRAERHASWFHFPHGRPREYAQEVGSTRPGPSTNLAV
jgi:hypothetical protein